MDIALLDFENGQGKCEEKGTARTNSVVRGIVKGSNSKSIVFKLGVPFEWNHVDNVAVPSPLNVGAMFWNWQFGYKFARFDLVHWKWGSKLIQKFQGSILSFHHYIKKVEKQGLR